MLFGAYAPPAPESGMAAVEELERAVGRTLDIVLWYQHSDGPGSAFSPEWVDGIVAGGRIPLLTWEPWAPGPPEQPAFRLSRIADGAYDSYVEGWARSLEVYGKTLYLRPMHRDERLVVPVGRDGERELGERLRAGLAPPARDLRSRGRGERALGSSPLVDDVPATPANALERYYPGSRYVDVLALDGYNRGTSVPGFGGWRSFDAMFAAAYARIARLGSQPVWIAETASDAGRRRQGRLGARHVRGPPALPEDRRRGVVPHPQGARLARHELAGGGGRVQGVDRGASSVSGCPQWLERPRALRSASVSSPSSRKSASPG